MKFQYFSDIHSEGHNNTLEKILPVEALIKKDEGVVFLAGDIMVYKNLKPGAAFQYLEDANVDFFYIPGNHEFYGSSVQAFEEIVKSYCQVIERENEIFFLTPLWSFLSDRIKQDVVDGVSDFRLIKGHTAETHNEVHYFCKNFLKVNLEKFNNDARKKIIVTHFTPSYMSVHPKWAGSILNNYFSNNLDDLILEYQPDVWIHGHTHDAFDYKIGNTRILCNPLGYSFEYYATKSFHFNVIEI